MANDYTNLPDFDSLPEVKGMPQGCAWGVFDKDGKKDHLGCVNLLTPAVVKAAYKEAKDGVSVSLNWPIGAINKPGFMRVSQTTSCTIPLLDTLHPLRTQTTCR